MVWCNAIVSLTLSLSVQVSTGVVVDVGHSVVTCAAVVDGDQRHYVNCDPSEATPTKLADMVHDVITGSHNEDSDVNELSLMQQVVVTGWFILVYV